MGKYMKKAKITGDVVAVMELSQPTALGVRTRAKTLALRQRLHSTSSSAAGAGSGSDSCYLQLRSRRLEKPPPPVGKKGESRQLNLSSKSGSRLRAVSSAKSGGGDREGCLGNNEETLGAKCEVADELGVEASFGENFLDSEGAERGTRESTPCSLIRDSDTIRTPVCTTPRRSSSTTNQRVRNNIQRNIPSSHEMEEFFACAEQQQRSLFIERYNYDIESDSPLPGRYQWVQVIP